MKLSIVEVNRNEIIVIRLLRSTLSDEGISIFLFWRVEVAVTHVVVRVTVKALQW